MTSNACKISRRRLLGGLLALPAIPLVLGTCQKTARYKASYGGRGSSKSLSFDHNGASVPVSFDQAFAVAWEQRLREEYRNHGGLPWPTSKS